MAKEHTVEQLRSIREIPIPTEERENWLSYVVYLTLTISDVSKVQLHIQLPHTNLKKGD